VLFATPAINVSAARVLCPDVGTPLKIARLRASVGAALRYVVRRSFARRGIGSKVVSRCPKLLSCWLFAPAARIVRRGRRPLAFVRLTCEALPEKAFDSLCAAVHADLAERAICRPSSWRWSRRDGLDARLLLGDHIELSQHARRAGRGCLTRIRGEDIHE
jgi:hypothetical protein